MPSALQNFGLPLSPVGMGLLLFCILGVALIVALSRKEFGATLDARRAMFDEAARQLDEATITVGRDGYPTLSGLRGGRRVVMELVADSLVPRRLPQLWLRLTLLSPQPGQTSSIGVLARPVGTEFYSRVLELPETVAPTFPADFPMLMRGRDVTEAVTERTSGLFRTLFADPTLKEVVITPRGCGMVRQVAEGDRGAHVLYRQIRFPVSRVPGEMVRKALAELDLIGRTLAVEPARKEVSA